MSLVYRNSAKYIKIIFTARKLSLRKNQIDPPVNIDHQPQTTSRDKIYFISLISPKTSQLFQQGGTYVEQNITRSSSRRLPMMNKGSLTGGIIRYQTGAAWDILRIRLGESKNDCRYYLIRR